MSAPVRPVAAPPAVQPGTGRTGFAAGLAAVYAGQLGRTRVARVPLLFVATLQSLGILLLLRGVVDRGDAVTRETVVAGATVLVVAFVALNLLAQRLGALRAAGALDYYAALPVPTAAVLLGIAASYATFAAPGAVLTAVVGAVLYGLPLGHLWVLAPVLLTAAAALAGLGGLFGLLPSRPEIATVAGQLGMSAVLFLGIIPAGRLPLLLRPVRALVPSTYAVDALAASFRPHPAWGPIVLRLVAEGLVGVVTLAAAGWALRRAVSR